MNDEPEISRGGSLTLIKSVPFKQVQLSCSEGYKLPPVNISVYKNGVWDPPKLECIPLSILTELPKIGDGVEEIKSSAQPPYHINDKAILNCKPGYSFSSTHISKVIVDNGSLRWEPQILDCVKVACLPPNEIPNGKFTPEQFMYYFTDSIRCTCDPGFILKGDNKIYYCGPSGEWTPEIKNIHCIKDPNILKISPCPKMDSNLNFQEKNGYNLVWCGNYFVKVRCLDGQWEYKYPYCDQIKNVTLFSNNIPLPNWNNTQPQNILLKHDPPINNTQPQNILLKHDPPINNTQPQNILLKHDPPINNTQLNPQTPKRKLFSNLNIWFLLAILCVIFSCILLKLNHTLSLDKLIDEQEMHTK